MCFCLPRRSPKDPERKSRIRRVVTMPIFSHTNNEALPTLRNMVNLSTILIPTRNAFFRTPSTALATASATTTTTTSNAHSRRSPAARGVPKINVNGLDGAAQIDEITSPVLGARTTSPIYDVEGNIDLNLSCMAKLDRAFHDICRRRSLIMAKDSTISRDQFVAWLQNIQGEEPENVEKLLPLDKERYTQGEFLETWILRFGWDAERVVHRRDKDLDRPITNYFISSSHNTYLEGNQLASRSSPEAYKNVLSRGCRCIEIDVWNGNTITPAQAENDKPKNGRPDHERNLSGTSLPNIAANVIETVGGMASVLSDRGSTHSRTLSGQSKADPIFQPVRSISDNRVSYDKLDVAPSTRPRSGSRPYPRNEPIVTHGWTLTTPCGFREVCVAIRESAFVTNDLPIIISLEVHADHGQQEVMVRIMKEEWGNLLLDEPLEAIDPRFRVPTLDALRRKILVKVKKPPKKIEVPASTLTLSPGFALDEDGSGSEEGGNAQNTLGVSASKLAPPPTPSPDGASPKAAMIPVGPILGGLAIYTHSERFKRFEEVSKKPSHIYSIAESRILELYTTHAREVFTHNKNFFMRLFPNGARIDSSNPDPSPFWRKGVQMVSLNWQFIDEAMMLNEGMFAGEQGWVLKPPGYRGSDKHCTTQADVGTVGKVMLSIAILSAQHVWIPELYDEDASNLRPVVKCELHVENGGKSMTSGNDKYKLETSSRKTDHPDWGDKGEILKFPLARNIVEELSFVRFKIEDDSTIGRDELLSWACIRLDRLRSGYRYVRLMDAKGRPIKDGKLLIRVSKVTI